MPEVTKGRCFGIDVTKPEHIPAVAPPPPPERDGMPGPFPALDDEGKYYKGVLQEFKKGAGKIRKGFWGPLY